MNATHRILIIGSVVALLALAAGVAWIVWPHAGKAAAAKQDTHHSESYAARAIAELTAARKEGYFKDPYRIEFLAGERDLDGLRQRADFQAPLVPESTSRR